MTPKIVKLRKFIGQVLRFPLRIRIKSCIMCLELCQRFVINVHFKYTVNLGRWSIFCEIKRKGTSNVTTLDRRWKSFPIIRSDRKNSFLDPENSSNLVLTRKVFGCGICLKVAKYLDNG